MTQRESNPDLLAEIVEEWQNRLRKGERPSLDEYVARYPDIAGELRELLPGLAAMEDLKGDVLDYTVAPTSGGTQVDDASPRLEQLGDFRILREVGRGGMGVVYEAEQVSLGRRVALKVLPKKVLIDPKQKRRFEREARSAAKLHHTNIVPVFGVGEHDGIPYYVMQFIDGLPLDSVLNEIRRMHASPSGKPAADAFAPTLTRQDVSAADVARSLVTGNFGADIAGAPTSDPDAPRLLESRPASGSSPNGSGQVGSTPSITLPGDGSTVSRSKSKPRNYWQSIAALGAQVADALEHAHKQGILHRDIKPSNLLLDTQGTVWVTDFGLAKGDDQENLTHTGDILGTLRYMPPEAFEGRADARGDIYSLGLTLYEMLALRPAFDERDRHLLIKNVTTGEPDRLDKVNRTIPRDLVTIVHKSIDRDPAHRYRTAGELAADLQRFLADEPILARRSTPWERTLRWMRRKPAAAALVGMSTLATLAVAAVVLILVYSSELHKAKAAAEQARTEAEQSRDAESEQRRQAEAARLEAEKQQKLADNARLEAEHQRNLAETARKEAEAEREQAILQRGLLAVHTKQWAEAAADLGAYVKSHPDDIKAWLNLGEAHAGLAERDKAVTAFTKAIDLNTDNVAARLGRAEQQAARGRFNEAIADYEHAFRINPDLPDHAAGYARALYEGMTGWRVLEPTQATASGGRTTLKVLPDFSIVATGLTNDVDSYTIVAPANLAGIRSIRLEILADTERTSPGAPRPTYSSGNFILTDFSATVSPAGKASRKIAFDRAWSSYATTYVYYPSGDYGRSTSSSWDIRGAIDRDPKTGWGVFGQYNRAFTAVFVVDQPAPAGKDSAITLQLRFPTGQQVRQNSIGRFRLSVSTNRPAPAWELLINGAALNINGWAKLAAARYLRGDGAGAIDALGRAERVSSTDQNLIQLLRSILFDQPDRKADALASYEKAMEQQRSNPYGYYHHSYGYGDLTYRWLAVEAATRWIEREPASILYRRHRAESLAGLENLTDAIADYDVLIRAEPSEHRYMLERGDCYARLNQAEKARADFAEAGRMSPDDALAWHRSKLQVFEQMGAALPLAHLDACLELEKGRPGAYELHLKRGRTYALLGKKVEAGDDFARAVKLNPSSPDALLERGGWFLQQGDREAALADFATARKINSTTAVNWHSNQVNRFEYGATRNIDLALVHLGEMVAAEGQPPATRISALQRRIWLLQQSNRAAEAISDYTKLIELQPRDVTSRVERGACYAQSGQFDKAAEDFAAAMKVDRVAAQQQIRGKLTTAESVRNWRLVTACIDAWLQSKLAPKDETDLLRRRARARKELGQYASALADCERILSIHADDSDAIRVRAATQAALAEELDLRGETAAAQEQRRLARTALENLLKAQPDSAVVAGELANVLLMDVAAWRILDPVQMRSAGGATLTRLPDGSVLAKGDNPPSDSYTVLVRTNQTGIRAFLLETLPDPSLPQFGPGRAANGNFVLGEIRIREAAKDGKERPIQLDRAWATFETRSATVFYPARDAIDGKRWTVWEILPQTNQPRSIGLAQEAVFTTREVISGSASGTTLSVTLECGIPRSADQNIGRFRLYASSSDKAMHAEQIRTSTASGWLKLAAARVLMGERENAEAMLQKLVGTKGTATPVNLALTAWIREQIQSDDAARAARTRALAPLLKKSGAAADAPVPMPLVVLDVLDKGIEENADAMLHLWRGKVREHLGDAKGAADSYSQLIAQAPESSDYYLLRGRLYLRTHQWKQAAADLRKAADLKPDDHFLWFAYAPLHLWAGDEEGYLDHRKAMLERFGKTTDPQIAERTVKECSLRPATTDENKVLLELVKRAVTEATAIPQWARYAHALVSHRAGDSAMAIEQSRLAREADAVNTPLTGYVQVGTRLIEAMGQHRLGQADEAKRLLAEADEMNRKDLPDIEETSPDGQFHDLVICKLLEREARLLIEPDAPLKERGPAPRETGESKK